LKMRCGALDAAETFYSLLATIIPDIRWCG
jgi:hypothetical protein